ncbi:GNAT family N-acetyltransferase [Rhizobium cremeum]|nr:GNAT family N-acetyltransferase [Rhizobium cremeum]MCJ7997231.1 GNAT family N-acetyltransferase [Rhizobium cremeum]MCJ8001891.1 GNAT family N-acetyltransferase [Rhizobium cremeum]
MTIKLNRLDDRFERYDELLDLILRAFAYMDGAIDPPSSAHRLTSDLLRRKAQEEVGVVASQDDRLVACAFFRPEPGSLYIGKLAVLPEVQGKGVGRRLLAEAETVAEALGLVELRLETRIELSGNHRRFAAWGFRKTAENSHPGYTRITSIEMRKTLA